MKLLKEIENYVKEERKIEPINAWNTPRDSSAPEHSADLVGFPSLKKMDIILFEEVKESSKEDDAGSSQEPLSSLESLHDACSETENKSSHP